MMHFYRAIVGLVFIGLISSPALAIIFPVKGEVSAARGEETGVVGDIIVGEDNAPVTIIEYASLSCPHCAAFFQKIYPDIKKNYIDTGKAKLIYRHFPLNEPALRGAMLVECGNPDRRYNLVGVLFNSQSKWAFEADFIERLKKIGKIGGISEEEFSTCMVDKALEEKILAIRLDASQKEKVTSTPSFIINGELTKALPYEDFAKLLDSHLAKAKE